MNDQVRNRERDLVLGPGEFANILDETKGNVSVYVGPVKASLSVTDRPVIFDPKTRRFEECTQLEDAILTFPYAPKGSYIVLTNPSIGEDDHPKSGISNNLPRLDYGSKINIEGPDTFALFPGQEANVVSGHRLRSNQYLVVRVYDEEAAEKNWSKAVIKAVKGEDGEALDKPDLTMGKLIVIEGTKVSFYIPPTGIEIVVDPYGNYVREAVTLERLEYCILLDEDGNKRYLQGPAVVFPKPTEKFIEKDGKVKFRAIELTELMGLYIKVIVVLLFECLSFFLHIGHTLGLGFLLNNFFLFLLGPDHLSLVPELIEIINGQLFPLLSVQLLFDFFLYLLKSGPPYDMIAELCFYHIADFAFGKCKSRLLKLRHHLPLTEETQIATPRF